jgi:hypothetical protein
MRFRMKPINAGPLKAFGYDHQSEVLRLEFTMGIVDFYAVTPAIYQQFLETFPKKDFVSGVLRKNHPRKEVAPEDHQRDIEQEPIVVNARMIYKETANTEMPRFPWLKFVGHFWSWGVLVGLVVALILVMYQNEETPRRAGSVIPDTPRAQRSSPSSSPPPVAYSPALRKAQAETVLEAYPSINTSQRKQILDEIGTARAREYVQGVIDRLPIDKDAKGDLWDIWWAENMVALSPRQATSAAARPSVPAKKSLDEELDGILGVPTAKTPLLNRTLPHGTNVSEPEGTTGHGSLIIKNGLPRDAFVLLFGSNVRRHVYLAARTDITLQQIPPCQCSVLFTSGVDWDGERFTRNKTFSEFDEPLIFVENERIKGREWTISLDPQKDGTASIHGLSEADFEKARLKVLTPSSK